MKGSIEGEKYKNTKIKRIRRVILKLLYKTFFENKTVVGIDKIQTF